MKALRTNVRENSKRNQRLSSFTMRASNAARSKAVRASLVLERFLSAINVGFLGLVSQETNDFDTACLFTH